MGRYLNPGNEGFAETVSSEIYIDKTDMINYTNRVLESESKYVCVSRPRRFGKSIAAKMLVAYYSKGCDSKDLFKNLSISKQPFFAKYMNQYDVIRLDIQWMYSVSENKVPLIEFIQDEVIHELKESYPEYIKDKEHSLAIALSDIFHATKRKFIIIIDEWDCVFREEKKNEQLQETYISLLRSLFKGVLAEETIALAYMTGILPIKKYGTQSALNNFNEYTMVDPSIMAPYMGFTEDEVKGLCQRYSMDYEEARRWYDGYKLRKAGHIYSPKSVVEAMYRQDYGSYWTSTETYESLKGYITGNFDGLKDAVIKLLAGQSCPLEAGTFQNDMTSMENKDEVLTLLVHLGYLAYDAETETVSIPNEEVRREFKRAVTQTKWTEVIRALNTSNELLQATLSMDTDVVSRILDEVHTDNTSILEYNDENALSCVISIAYYSAREYYTIIRELPSGKGFADLVFIPNKEIDKPALVVELKWDKSARGAISQIKEKDYAGKLVHYAGEILLVGINYDKKQKKHECVIEQYTCK